MPKPHVSYRNLSDEDRAELADRYQELLTELRKVLGLDCEEEPCPECGRGFPAQVKPGHAIAVSKRLEELTEKRIALLSIGSTASAVDRLRVVERELEIAHKRIATVEAENERLRTAAIAASQKR